MSKSERFLIGVLSFGYHLWDFNNGGRLTTVILPHGVQNIALEPMFCISPTAFTADHEYFAAGVRKILYIWRMGSQGQEGQLVQNLDAHFARILDLIALKKGYLVTSSIDRTVKVWNVRNIFEKVYHVDRLDKPIEQIFIAKNRPDLALTMTRKYASLWNIKTHRLVATFVDVTHTAVITHACVFVFIRIFGFIFKINVSKYCSFC